VVAAMALIAAGCGSSSDEGGGGGSAAKTSSDGKEVITFGLQTSVTGAVADYGKPQVKTIELWMEKVNKAGGLEVGGKKYQLALKQYDNKSDVNQDAPLTTRLITEDKVDLLFGPVSSLHAANACPVNERYKIPAITTFAFVDSVYERGLKYCFSAQPPTSRQYDAVVDLFAKNDLKNIVIAAPSDELGNSIVSHVGEAAEKVGVHVVDTRRFPPTTKDFSTVLAQIKAKNPDAIAVGGVPETSIRFRQQMVSFGMKTKLTYFESGPNGAGLGWEAAGGPGEFAVATSAWTPSIEGNEPDADSIWGSNAAIDGEKVRNAIAAVTGTNFYGPIEFDERGLNVGPVASAVVIQAQGDSKSFEYPVVWPQDKAEKDLVIPDPKTN
jgi:branched-chain amino acid transport system substrate-binding protein